MLSSLLKTCIRSAGHGLTTAGLITGYALGTSGAGTADDLIAVGDAETDLGSFRIRSPSAETIDLFRADVLITGDAMTGSELITSDLGGAANQGSGHAGA